VEGLPTGRTWPRHQSPLTSSPSFFSILKARGCFNGPHGRPPRKHRLFEVPVRGSLFIPPPQAMASSASQSSPSAASSTDNSTSRAYPVTATSGSILNTYSCLSCRKKKKKCNRIYPCNNCQRLGNECVFTQRRVSARQKPSAMERLRHLESIVGRLRSDLHVDPLLADKDGPDDSLANPCHQPSPSNTSDLEAEFGRLAIADGRSRYVVGSFWASLADEVRAWRSLQ
jgi:hypothetical protein